MHRLRLIILCSLCVSASLASDNVPKLETIRNSTESTSTSTSIKVSSGDVNSAEYPFESSHKIQQSEEFQTSHRISEEALKQHREDLHQSMRSKEKPELNEQLGELIAADIKNNIEAKRLSEYEHYVVEPLTTTVKPVLTTEATVARSINEGLIDDFSILEEAGSENKQASRIQIKKGPNGQDYEYEYVYYYYDDDESKTAGDDDVIIGSRKGSSTTTTTTQAPAGSKSRYSNIERGSSSSTSAPEKNEIPSRGKARAQALPAPVVEEIVEERLPQVTRFPQRAKSANPSENAPETAGGKKQHVKRPSLELVDSHSFVTDEKDKNSKGPRIIETELSKSELLETVSKSSVEYVSSSTTDATDEDEEDTTPLMEKFAIDLYAILANENAKEDDKKSKSDSEETTVASDDELTTIEGEEVTVLPSTTTTTEATTTTVKTTTTTEEPTTTTELPKGRGGLTAGRNRFKFQPKGPPSSTEAPAEPSTESSKPKNRFSRPSSSFSSRNSGSRTTKSSNAPEEVKEEVSKSEAPTQSTSSKLGAKSRNRFSLRNQSTTVAAEKSADTESTTGKSLVKPRPQFSLRNRGRNGQTASTTEAASEAPEENGGEKEDKPVEKAASIVPRPTSRLNLNRPTARLLPGQKPRASHLNPRRNSTADENSEGSKSANENESEVDTTTPNNLNKLKSRPRIQINADSKAAKKTTSPAAINRKVNPLISKRKFGVTSTTETSVDDEKAAADTESDSSPKEGANESEAEVKEDETTQAAEATSEQPRGLGLLNRRKIVNRRPGTIN